MMFDDGEIRKRLSAHGSDHYLLIIPIFKGVTLAGAAVSLGLVVTRGSWQSVAIYVGLLYWLASFIAMVVTYDAILVGTVAITWVPTLVDVVVPFGSAIAEFSLFSVIGAVPWDGPADAQLNYLTYWVLVLGTFGLLSCILVSNAYHRLSRASQPGQESDAVAFYRSRLRRDIIGSGIATGAIGFAAFSILRVLPGTRAGYVQLLLGTFEIVTLVYALLSQEAERRGMAERVGVAH
jgi:hypothetical protein